jgi:hypothetical protein
MKLEGMKVTLHKFDERVTRPATPWGTKNSADYLPPENIFFHYYFRIKKIMEKTPGFGSPGYYIQGVVM